MSRPNALIFFYLFFLLSLTSCSKTSLTSPPITTLSQAQEYFLKICREELQYDVFIIPNGKTLWIYVPLAEGINTLQAAQKNQAPPSETKESWSINYLKSTFENETFIIRYDMTPTRIYDQGLTYKNQYSPDFSKKQREVLNALTRAYFDVGQKTISTQLTVGNEISTKSDKELVKDIINDTPAAKENELPPEFFVMVFADTKNGVAIKAINYFEDMRMALSNPPAISHEEYIKRYVSEIFGDEAIVGDMKGERLKTSEIVLSDFLAQQIETRIKYQFTQSNFPPTGELQDEIWNVVAETCRLYQFKDFDKIKLIDMQTQKESTYNKDQL